MGYKNIKHSILFSFLFWVGSVQSGHAQETAGQEAVPEMQTAVFTPPLISLSPFQAISARYVPTTFMAGWTSKPVVL